MVRFRCPHGCGNYHEHPDSAVGARTTCHETHRRYRILPVAPEDMPSRYSQEQAWSLLGSSITPIFESFALHTSFVLPVAIPYVNSDDVLRQRQIHGIRPKQYRLLACAFARWGSPLILGKDCLAAITTAEKFAEGACTRAELAFAEARAWDDWRRQSGPADGDEAARATALRAEQEAAWTALRAVRAGFRTAATRRAEVIYHELVQKSPKEQWPKLVAAIEAIEDPFVLALRPYAHLETTAIIEDILGSKDRPPGISSLRRWNGGTLVRLARTIHQHENFSDLPILADALEEAGCSDEYTLEHCRQKKNHYRGCWVLEWILNEDVWK